MSVNAFATTTPTSAPKTVSLALNGQTVLAHEGETLLDVAKRQGEAIPHLCFKEGLRADGNCRACVVEIKGERALAPSCCRTVREGMEVSSNNARVKKKPRLGARTLVV